MSKRNIDYCPPYPNFTDAKSDSRMKEKRTRKGITLLAAVAPSGFISPAMAQEDVGTTTGNVPMVRLNNGVLMPQFGLEDLSARFGRDMPPVMPGGVGSGVSPH